MAGTSPGHERLSYAGHRRAESLGIFRLMPLRLIFMGTPDFAVPTLLELVAHGHEVVAVYTRAPKPAGRGMKLQLSPVEQEARRLGIPVLDADDVEDAGSSRRIPRAQRGCGRGCRVRHDPAANEILDAPKLGCFNLHASLLPRWRGAAPINRAIMAGDAESGVMVMKMDVGLDTGDVAMAERLTITDTMTAADLHDALAPVGADLMVRAMGALDRGGLQLQKQSEDRRDLRRQDRQVRGADRLEAARARGAAAYSRPVAVSRRLVRDRHRWRAGTHQDPALRTGERLGAPGEVLDDRLTIACGEGAIRILELQRAGKAPMKSADFLRGTPLKSGARFA